MRYELYYWPNIQGRGEFVRLALEEAGADYVDVARRPGKNGMPAMLALLGGKRVPHPPFAPPFLKCGKLLIGQTANILFFLGARENLGPAPGGDAALGQSAAAHRRRPRGRGARHPSPDLGQPLLRRPAPRGEAARYGFHPTSRAEIPALFRRGASRAAAVPMCSGAASPMPTCRCSRSSRACATPSRRRCAGWRRRRRASSHCTTASRRARGSPPISPQSGGSPSTRRESSANTRNSRHSAPVCRSAAKPRHLLNSGRAARRRLIFLTRSWSNRGLLSGVLRAAVPR